MPYDLFISHASEDKDPIVRPLAILLEKLGLRVWYDETAIEIGDSLSASIDKGLRESRYGLLILSKSFLSKNWPEYEYRSLLTRQNNGEQLILPLWYNIDYADVKNYSLWLADRKALPVSTDNLNQVAIAVLRKTRPDIYRQLRMQKKFQETVRNAPRVKIPISQIDPQTTPQSKLTPQQTVRARQIHLGIGRHIREDFTDFVRGFELDNVPEYELQTWEIMNACYLEMLEKHPEADAQLATLYAKYLVAISVGMVPPVTTDEEIDIANELVSLWRQNYYKF